MTNVHDTARLLGLAVPDRRPQLRVSKTAAEQRLVRGVNARLDEMLGEDTQRAITRDLESIGLDPQGKWVYAEMRTAEVDANRLLLCRLVSRTSRGQLVPWPLMPLPYEWQDRHRGYRMEMLGLCVASDAPDGPMQAPWMWWQPSGSMKVSVRRMRAIPPETIRPVTVVDWRPGWPDVQITYGGPPGRSKADARAAEIGRELLLNVGAVPDGRPEGTGTFTGPLDFWEKIGPVVQELLRRPGRHRNKATRDEAARKLNISSGQLRDRTHALTGLEWPDVVKTIREATEHSGNISHPFPTPELVHDGGEGQSASRGRDRC